MLRRFSVTFSLFSMVLDGILAGFALRISGPIRPLLNGLPGVADVPFPIRLPEELYYLFPVIWVGIMLVFAVYDGRKNLRVVDEYSSLTASSILAMVAMAGVLFITYREVSRALFFFFCLLTFCLFVGWRAVVRLIFRHQLRGTCSPAKNSDPWRGRGWQPTNAADLCSTRLGAAPGWLAR